MSRQKKRDARAHLFFVFHFAGPPRGHVNTLTATRLATDRSVQLQGLPHAVLIPVFLIRPA